MSWRTISDATCGEWLDRRAQWDKVRSRFRQQWCDAVWQEPHKTTSFPCMYVYNYHNAGHYLKLDDSETVFCPCLQVEPTQVGQMEVVSVFTLTTGHNWVGPTWRRRQNIVSETSTYKWMWGRWIISRLAISVIDILSPQARGPQFLFLSILDELKFDSQYWNGNVERLIGDKYKNIKKINVWRLDVTILEHLFCCSL
jgi:hypothetical protein